MAYVKYKKPRAKCPYCGSRQSVNNDGTLHFHLVKDGVKTGGLCLGTGKRSDDDEPGYPECEKLVAASQVTKPACEFLDWLGNQGIALMAWRETSWVRDPRSVEQLLADWTGVDLQKVGAERRRLLAGIQEGEQGTLMGHRYARPRQPGNGRFLRATLENTFGLSCAWCPSCRIGNPYPVGGEPAATCHACGAVLRPASAGAMKISRPVPTEGDLR
jgi:hypothetical protein